MNRGLPLVVTTVPDEVAEISPTCVIVYLCLHYSDHPLTAAEISEVSGRPVDTIRLSLRQLRNHTDLIVRDTSTSDGRKYVYKIST